MRICSKILLGCHIDASQYTTHPQLAKSFYRPVLLVLGAHLCMGRERVFGHAGGLRFLAGRDPEHYLRRFLNIAKTFCTHQATRNRVRKNQGKGMSWVFKCLPHLIPLDQNQTQAICVLPTLGEQSHNMAVGALVQEIAIY